MLLYFRRRACRLEAPFPVLSRSLAGNNGGIALRVNLNVRSFLALIVKTKETIEGRVDYQVRPGNSIVLMAEPGVD